MKKRTRKIVEWLLCPYVILCMGIFKLGLGLCALANLMCGYKDDAREAWHSDKYFGNWY